MSRFISLRLAVAALIASVFVPVALPAQPQDSQSQSVAEAARRAREKKKTSTKPAQVITEDNLKPATPDMQPTNASAPVQTPDASGKPAAQRAPGDAKAPAGGPASAAGKDSDQKAKSLAELARLKQQLADAQRIWIFSSASWFWSRTTSIRKPTIRPILQARPNSTISSNKFQTSSRLSRI